MWLRKKIKEKGSFFNTTEYAIDSVKVPVLGHKLQGFSRQLLNPSYCEIQTKHHSPLCQLTQIHTKLFLNDGVVCEGDALPVDLAIATFVHQLTHRLQVRHSAMQQRHLSHL